MKKDVSGRLHAVIIRTNGISKKKKLRDVNDTQSVQQTDFKIARWFRQSKGMIVEGVYLRYLLCLRQINFSTSGNYRSFLKNGSQACIFKKLYDNYFLGYILKSQMASQVRCFKIYHSLRNDIEKIPFEEIREVKKSRSRGRKNDMRIIVTNERGVKSSMYFSEAEKYAKRNNLNLVKLDDLNYQFEKEEHIIVEKKTLKDNLKKFIVRDSIADHDLQIKINSMLKYVEKYEVLCVIENKQNKLDEVSNKIKNSALKEFVIGDKISSKRIIITLKKKATATEPNSESSKEIKNSERTKNNQSITKQPTN